MSELYWLTRLDGIEVLLVLGILFGIILLVGGGVGSLVWSDDEDITRRFIKTFKAGLITLVTSVILKIFIPTERDAFLILGIGGTVDYLQNSEVVKELPDKCINALDAWVESFTEENKNNNYGTEN